MKNLKIDGWIYYIACTETERVKIGFTSGKVEKRLKALQTGSPTRLTIIAVHPGNMDMERFFHHDFAEHCVHGEWFQMNATIFQHICAAVCFAASMAINHGYEMDRYTLRGLQAAESYWGELPPELASYGAGGATVQ